MKSACCALLLVAGLVLTGCGKSETTSTESTTTTPARPAAPTAPAEPATTVQPAPAAAPAAPARSGYVGAMVMAQQAAVKTVDVTSLNQAIQLFNVQEGRFPNDLNELVTKQYIGKLPAAPVGMKLVYDANQGKVTTARQ
jgi:hypothetical protein